MVFDNCNPFAGKKDPEGKMACFWYNQLWNKVISLYEWKGELFDGPDATLNRDYLEWVLLTQGQAAFVKDNEGNLRNLRCTRIGLDCYGFPEMLLCPNPVLGEVSGKVGKDAVWVRNNKFAQPVIKVIEYYAGQLAKLKVSLDVNLYNTRTAKVFVAEDDQQAQQIRLLQDRISQGETGVIIKDSLWNKMIEGTNQNQIPVYSCASEYLTDKYLNDIRSVLMDFYTCFGINESGAYEKKERNLTNEVDSNNQEIMVNRAFYLESRQKACEQVKQLFGVDISVNIRSGKNVEGSAEDGVQESEPSDE